jgi:hypothetical protein
LICGLASGAGPSWAKHHKTATPSSTSTDPCAEPTAFIEQRIATIRQLQTSLEPSTDNLVGWIQHMQGRHSVDPDKVAKISELRHDADRVNELLRAGGCKTIDVQQELNPSASSSLPPQQ